MYTPLKHRAEIKRYMRDFIVNSGSEAVTISDVQGAVKDKITGSPSFSTIKGYLEDFQKEGYMKTTTIETQSAPRHVWNRTG